MSSPQSSVLRGTHRATSARWVDDVGRDVRIAIRALRRTPGFTLSVALSLALGFGLVAATIGVARAYAARALPYPEPRQLYRVRYAPPGPVEPRGMSAIDWKSLTDVVTADITSSGQAYYIADGGYAQTARGVSVSPGFISALGVRAAIGRSLHADDFAAGSGGVALIGHALWRTRFGSDSGVIGRELRLEPEGAVAEHITVRIIGVLTPGFWYGRDSQEEVDILTPLRAPARTYMVRLRDGVTVEHAERRLTDAALAVATWIPPDWRGVELHSVYELYLEGLRPVLLAILVAATLVLLITWVNVTVLLVLRTLRRQKEIAVRIALGAGRGTLARMFAIEIGLVCMAGLGAGVALSAVALRLLAPLIQERLGRPAFGGTDAMAVDQTAVVIVAVVAAMIALSFAVVPACMGWQERLSETLRRTGRTGTDSVPMRRARTSLIALEVAGSVALLIACGLMIRSAVGMMRTDLVFERDDLVRVRVVLRGGDYPDAAAYRRFYEELDRRLSERSLAPAFTNWPPFIEAASEPVESADRPDGAAASGVLMVGERYFDMLEMEVRQGRAFSTADRLEGAPVAIVSETLARQLWPDGGALGRRVRQSRILDPGQPPAPWRTIIGVVADARQSYADPIMNDLYAPFWESPGRFGSFYLRSAMPVSTVTATLHAVVAELDPNAVVRDVRPVTSEDRQLKSATFMMSLLSAFAGLAALLAVLGIYGVVAYGVQQRERELAIRMAVGATGGAIVGLLLRDGIRVVVVGVVLGSLGSIALTRVLRQQLFGVGVFDAPTVAIACLLMVAAGATATWWPARRAASAQPLVALNEN